MSCKTEEIKQRLVELWKSNNTTFERKHTIFVFLWSQVVPVAYSQGEGDVSPRFQARGQSCKSPPTFLTHNDAIAVFTSQSLGLPAYTCKTGSSTAIKLTPIMHHYTCKTGSSTAIKLTPIMHQNVPF